MRPPLRLVVGSVACVAALAVAACQALPFEAAASRPVPAPTVPAAPPATGSRMASSTSPAVVWGKVPDCTCQESPGTANIVAALKRAHLAVAVQGQTPTNGWLYFAVTFDPNLVSRDQIAAAVQAGGGTVVAGPP